MGEAEVGLVLTAVGRHMIANIYGNNTPAAHIDPSFLLRAEWVDTQGPARQVRGPEKA